ncbi:HD-GYP domain-containing protein [Tuberibacillus sp. Marseille-P3662]|uniref:HD-GYP domain-containing protein n=1 Tax=Tuberibacillus sp. Marseille-P3662 TaxID=1965358 RepID=UPI000A1CE28B|nr:HD-GYP domain-containing protein [Tuberibacillus sp. Marseille-P3662]
MKVKREHLIEGCILQRDIIGKSRYPIIKANTVLEQEHLHVLEAFLVQDVHVKDKLKDGQSFQPQSQQSVGKPPSTMGDGSLRDQYIYAVEQFKQQFTYWESGWPINILEIRQLIIPILQDFLNNKKTLLLLNQYASKEDYIYHHCVTVGLLSGFIADKLGYSCDQIHSIAVAGLLADSGMAKMPPHIFRKHRSLTPQERDRLKMHPILSYRLVKSLPTISDEMALAILQHHEREDGTGYPHQFKSQKIHAHAKIIAVADVFHAMVSERIYKKGKSPFQVLELMRMDHFGQFEQRILDIFVNEVVNSFKGTKVYLSNQREGTVVFIQAQSPTRPMVQLTDGQILSLSDDRSLHIEKILDH